MKSRSSKLDRYADQLSELDAEKKTLAEMVEWLKAEGCVISASRVSDYLEAQRSARRQAAMLAQITSGARQCAEVEKQFGKNPAPALDTLIKLHRVMIMQLSTQSVDNPELLKLTDQLTRTVMEFRSGEAKAAFKKQELDQSERKIALLEKKSAAFDQIKALRDPQAAMNDADRKAIIAKVDEILGLK